jgi:hypothetical protein
MAIFDQKFLMLVAGMVAGAIRATLGWLSSGSKINPKQYAFALIRTALFGGFIGFNSANADPVSVFFQIYTMDTLVSKGYEITQLVKNNVTKTSTNGGTPQ